MARQITHADRSDDCEWFCDLVQSTRGLARPDRLRLQEMLNAIPEED